MREPNEMQVAAVANWFGRDGAVADRVSRELDGCNWIGVPFAGGMGMLASLKCNQGVASDLHHHVINLAAVISDPELSERLAERLSAVPLNSIALTMAKIRCMSYEDRLSDYQRQEVLLFPDYCPQSDFKPRAFNAPAIPDVDWALDYYIVSWMGRAGDAGTAAEFGSGDISVRWKATGGSSSSRWRSAVASVPGWSDVLRRWAFVCTDAFEFLAQCIKVEKRTAGELKNGLYLDPPFPDVGEPYTHNFMESQQRQLAAALMPFSKTRVVVRYHDHPLIRELYPASHWTWIELAGRAQTNEARAEVLLINGPSRTADSA